MNSSIFVPVALRRYGRLSVTLLDQGFVSAANFLTIVLLARELTLTSFGVFMLAQTVLTLLTTLQNALVTQPHNILGAQRQGIDYARLTLMLGTLQLAASVAVTVIAVIVGASLHAYNVEYAQIAFALAAAVLPWMGQEFVRRVLYTQGDVMGAAINNWVSYGLQLLGILALTLNMGGLTATPAATMLVFGASSLVAVLLGGWQLYRQHRAELAAARRALLVPGAFRDACVDSWRLSKWLVAQQVVAWLGASGHGWILAALLGPAIFGAYRAAYQVVNILNPLRQAACNHLPSHASRLFATQGASALRRWLRRLTWQLVVPFALGALIVTALSEPLAKIMYGTELQLAGLQAFVALGALAYVLNFARTPLDFALLASGAAPVLFRRTVWLAVFVLSAGALLIWQFGIFGALLSEIITALLAAAFAYHAYAALSRRAVEANTPQLSYGQFASRV